MAIVDLIGSVSKYVVALASGLASLFFEGSTSFVSMLVQFLESRVTNRLKAHILIALGGFVTDEGAAEMVLQCVDDRMRFSELRNPALLRLPACTSQDELRAEMLLEEPMGHHYEQTIAFVRLLDSMVERYGMDLSVHVDERPRGWAPYHMFCVHDLFHALPGLQFDDPVEKWTVGPSICVVSFAVDIRAKKNPSTHAHARTFLTPLPVRVRSSPPRA